MLSLNVSVILILSLLDILHSGNGGVTSMTSRARVSVWWPGITASIERIRQNCRSCDKVVSQLLLPPQFPVQTILSNRYAVIF